MEILFKGRHVGGISPQGPLKPLEGEVTQRESRRRDERQTKRVALG